MNNLSPIIFKFPSLIQAPNIKTMTLGLILIVCYSLSDSYFTEKYLGFPSKHPLEYDNADLTKKAANLKDRRFMLIHSTANTLITPQHSLMLAKALINQDILFQQLVGIQFSVDIISKV